MGFGFCTWEEGNEKQNQQKEKKNTLFPAKVLMATLHLQKKICNLRKMTIKHEHLHVHTGNRPQYICLAYTINHTESPWPFNYSTSHLVHHELPWQGNSIFCLFFYFVFCSTFATIPSNRNWPSAPLWSYRAFTYEPFPGLIALQYNLHLYCPLHTNMIWRLCPW